ncbi:hypothetical protein TNCV_184371 [Trichonephila clavipes]|nr:hypothetical protein TNCV_184371 [Trichonephila clavipes]
MLCNTTTVGFESLDSLREDAEQHRRTGPAMGIMVWAVLNITRTLLLVRIAGTLNSQRYIPEVLEPVVFFLTFRV